MKGIKLYLILILVIGAIVTLSIYQNTIKAWNCTRKLADIEIVSTRFQGVDNPGIKGFASMKAKAIPFLLQNLISPDEKVRFGSIIAFGNIDPNKEAVPELMKLLKTDSEAELKAVIWVLAKYKDQVKAAEMVKVLSEAKTDMLKIACCDYFITTSNGSASHVMTDLLSDPSIKVAEAACKSLRINSNPDATPALIKLAKRAHAEKNDVLLQTVNSTIILSYAPEQAAVIIPELKSNAIPSLLQACREYAKRTSSAYRDFIQKGILSEDEVEAESAFAIADTLSQEAKLAIAKKAINGQTIVGTRFGLSIFGKYGTADDLQMLKILVLHEDMGIKAAAIKAVGDVIDRIRIGEVPTYGNYNKENPRIEYIELILDQMSIYSEVETEAHESLKKLCDPREYDNVTGTYDSWWIYWTELMEVRGKIAELVLLVSEVKSLVGNKTRENMEAAKKKIDRAAVLIEELETIAVKKTSIANWTKKRRGEIDQLMYLVNKSKPLDIMGN